MPFDDARQRQQNLSSAYPTYEDRVKYIGDNRVGPSYARTHTAATAHAWNDHYARDFGSYDALRDGLADGHTVSRKEYNDQGDFRTPDPIRTDTSAVAVYGAHPHLAVPYEHGHGVGEREYAYHDQVFKNQQADAHAAHLAAVQAAAHHADHEIAVRNSAARGQKLGPMRSNY